jgi:hypothetical protein
MLLHQRLISFSFYRIFAMRTFFCVYTYKRVNRLDLYSDVPRAIVNFIHVVTGDRRTAAVIYNLVQRYGTQMAAPRSRYWRYD